mmetsp:Transcript_9550/g.18541  ORF Transcript_9550/g.18541 Transcript_9550/m.18541 type:complete len:318 (-) Transcript_9550:415-1368(-)|eukprot:CAMPEP_0173385830 /NCGR_PEP_ID=MMETSP1356-20130122/8433_1 /TAXON_ID=77927 ORGANISM="Hemiselmis virescens, Strain PCC157" /NCGR_SAMPLE_ID=MMETSP1356 /ASSEMBLY_ACC=CAM_ASM_000847 /LENGTH=317 /DNA_ID=CAMNT_0014341811 /DNA_START=84 /DNA_END=1037 /DNA_ORIENTATION=-
MSVYGDVHRAAVQVFLVKKYMTEKETLVEIRKVFSAYQRQEPPTNSNQLSTFFDQINDEIGTGGINHAEIKRLKIEGVPEPIWGMAQVLVEEEQNPQVKEATIKALGWMSPSQLELFKLVVEAIVKAGAKGGKVDYNRAINMGRFSTNRRRNEEDEEAPMQQLKDLVSHEATATLDRLVELEWLNLVKVSDMEARGTHNNNRFTLGIRSILDLRKYIETRYDDPCCVWTNGGDFKWVVPNDAGGDDGEDGNNAPAKRARAPSSRTDEAGQDGGDTEDDDEEEEEEVAKKSKADKESPTKRAKESPPQPPQRPRRGAA